ncbi:MAG: N-6 DNA methylase [Bacteroidota bacterium]
MLDTETKRRIDTARDILVGKVPDPKSQVEQITIALIYKFMDDMDLESEELGGERSFFKEDFGKYAWRRIFDPRMGGFEILNFYSEAIMKMNVNPNIPQLFRDIFKNAILPYRDPETLKAFLKVINDFTYDHSERLGDAFEYLLSVLGSQGEAGQFRTPRHIIDFMVEIIDPKKDDIILDPACGTAGFLISSYKHIIKHNSSNYDPEEETRAFEVEDVHVDELTINSKKYSGDKLTPDERSRLAKNIKGYDISPDMVRLSLVNMYLHGLHSPLIHEYDTLTSEDKWNEYADIILANPPFMSPKGGIRPHKRFSITSKRSEVLFVDYIVEHLTPNGRAAVIVPEGIIFQSGTAYKNLRKMLVENYLVGVISLPAGVFQPYSGVKTSILWMDRTLAKKTDKILFVKIENDGFDLGAQRRPIKQNDLPNALREILHFKNSLNSQSEIQSENLIDSIPIDRNDIQSNQDLNLSRDRYIQALIPTNSEYRLYKIDEILNLDFGSRITKKNDEGTVYPVYGGGGESFRTDNYNRRDDLVISRFAMSPECVRFVKGKFFLLDSGFTYSIKESMNMNIDKRYTDYVLLNIQDQIYNCSRGHAQRNLDIRQFKLLEIPLPPLSVQEEIVAEIESYQKIIDGAKQVVENYKPRIDIDPEWPMVELGKVCETSSGGTPLKSRSEYYGGNIPWLKSGEVAKGKIYSVEETITDIGLKNSSAKLFPIDTVLIAMYGATAGKIGLLKISSTTNQAVCAVLPNKNFIPEFLFYYLLGQTEFLISQCAGGAQPNISQTIIKRMKIPMPNLDVQDHIVDNLEEEQRIIDSNMGLVQKYEQKIKDRIAKVWGEL